MRRAVARVGVVALLLAGGVAALSPSPAAAAGESWVVDSVNTTGCTSSAIGMSTTVEGIETFPTTLRFRTVVTVDGLVYMDEDAGNPSSNGGYGWSIYPSASGGPTTGTFPLPAGELVRIDLFLIEGVGGPTATHWVVWLDGCDTGNVLFSGPFGTGTGVGPRPTIPWTPPTTTAPVTTSTVAPTTTAPATTAAPTVPTTQGPTTTATTVAPTSTTAARPVPVAVAGAAVARPGSPNFTG